MELKGVIGEALELLKQGNPAEPLVDFFKSKLFGGNEKSVAALDEYLANTSDSKQEGKLETLVEMALEGKPLMINELSDALTKAKNFVDAQESMIEINVHQASDTVILVPWDFSTVAQYALEHAVQYAEITGGKITLLHIVSKEKELPEAIKKLSYEAESAAKKYGIKPSVMAREGSIFTEISEVAHEIEAKLVIMGTHGITGMQKLTGSKALKVIVDTKVPFIVVQAPPHSKLDLVLFPIDDRRETKQKIGPAVYLASLFKIKILLSKPANVSDEISRRKTNDNMVFIRSYLSDLDISFEEVNVEGAKDFADSTLKCAKKMMPDLILIGIQQDLNITDFILGPDEQKIIANDIKIPVMCVNPPKSKLSTGVQAF